MVILNSDVKLPEAISDSKLPLPIPCSTSGWEIRVEIRVEIQKWIELAMLTPFGGIQRYVMT